VYFVFERKVKDPVDPSSILESLKTSAFSSPTTVPLSNSAIWLAVNFIPLQKYKKLS
jgi:hypothetical protein